MTPGVCCCSEKLIDVIGKSDYLMQEEISKCRFQDRTGQDRTGQDRARQNVISQNDVSKNQDTTKYHFPKMTFSKIKTR